LPRRYLRVFTVNVEREMKLQELFEDWDNGEYYLPKINVYLRGNGLKKKEIEEVIGMLRGLANAIEGFSAVSGIYNHDAINQDKVRFRFSSVENARRFKGCVEKYFDADVLEKFSTKRVIRPTT
jgi:hypothetical protein